MTDLLSDECLDAMKASHFGGDPLDPDQAGDLLLHALELRSLKAKAATLVDCLFDDGGYLYDDIPERLVRSTQALRDSLGIDPPIRCPKCDAFYWNQPVCPFHEDTELDLLRLELNKEREPAVRGRLRQAILDLGGKL